MTPDQKISCAAIVAIVAIFITITVFAYKVEMKKLDQPVACNCGHKL